MLRFSEQISYNPEIVGATKYYGLCALIVFVFRKDVPNTYPKDKESPWGHLGCKRCILLLLLGTVKAVAEDILDIVRQLGWPSAKQSVHIWTM